PARCQSVVAVRVQVDRSLDSSFDTSAVKRALVVRVAPITPARCSWASVVATQILTIRAGRVSAPWLTPPTRWNVELEVGAARVRAQRRPRRRAGELFGAKGFRGEALRSPQTLTRHDPRTE